MLPKDVSLQELIMTLCLRDDDVRIFVPAFNFQLPAEGNLMALSRQVLDA
jgi:hypothetical protein